MKQSDFLRRMTDRSFLGMVTTMITAWTACIAAWQTAGIPVDQKINLTMVAIAATAATVAAFTVSEKKKDAAAIQAQNTSPTTINAGTVENVQSAASAPQQGIPQSENPRRDAIVDLGLDYLENRLSPDEMSSRVGLIADSAEADWTTEDNEAGFPKQEVYHADTAG